MTSSPPPSFSYTTSLHGDTSQQGWPSGSDVTALIHTGLTPPATNDLWSDLATNAAFNPEQNDDLQALCDYFNHQGGTGGITALDLGFSYEPSLFPQDLFGFRRGLDPRRHMATDRFAPCYLSPWSESLPPPERLEEFAHTATERMLARIPVLHEASMDFRELPNHTVYALSVVGGAYEAEAASQTFSGKKTFRRGEPRLGRGDAVWACGGGSRRQLC